MRSTTVSSARSVGFPPAQVYGLTVLGFFILRSRIHPRGLVCNQAMFDDCKQFLREPGSDSDESQWFKDGWCVTSSTEGRGD